MGAQRGRVPMLMAAVLLASALGTVASAQSSATPSGTPASSTAPTAGVPPGDTLRVCADPNNMPNSDKNGAGYENKLAEALAKDLGKKVAYTFFPQRMGFVRNTLNGRIEPTGEFKCDVIIGVPKGYELTATTQPYMHSTYALVVPERVQLGRIETPDDLLKLPKERLEKLRFGIFARTPATDWLLRNGLINQAALYAPQSADPDEHPASIVERDLEKGVIDVAIVWGPVAGFLADHHQGSEPWAVVPFKPDPQIRFDYEIAMGVRFADKEWKNTLDQWIGSHKPEIENILVSYRIPLLETTTAAAAR
ncbi:MAG TPA: quinoprotein dehydrogenase-associated putative ABC transporter substrate-binding protein [Steroidobacteraceae bacterium]|nr:quinoprotein dehydrogenase-associated putative ABC transporter substrate-binding protein [Steroidobacteraceae bacterium]